MRRRRDVQYDDGLTDTQFSQMLEKQTNESMRLLESRQHSVKDKKSAVKDNHDKNYDVGLSNDIADALLQIIQDISRIFKPDG